MSVDKQMYTNKKLSDVPFLVALLNVRIDNDSINKTNAYRL